MELVIGGGWTDPCDFSLGPTRKGARCVMKENGGAKHKQKRSKKCSTKKEGNRKPVSVESVNDLHV